MGGWFHGGGSWGRKEEQVAGWLWGLEASGLHGGRGLAPIPRGLIAH